MTMITTSTSTIAATPMATASDAPLLQLIWLASPALPIGGFSYSEGMESAIDAQLVTDEDTAARWLLDQLHLGLTRADLAVAAQAIAAWRGRDLARIAELDAWVLQTRETSELRQQTEQMGRSLIEWLKAVRPELADVPPTHLTYPVAFALAASDSGASVRDCLLAFAFGWAENMMQAALKSVPLGQSAGHGGRGTGLA
jgi:urease accessory protein